MERDPGDPAGAIARQPRERRRVREKAAGGNLEIIAQAFRHPPQQHDFIGQLRRRQPPLQQIGQGVNLFGVQPAAIVQQVLIAAGVGADIASLVRRQRWNCGCRRRR